MVATEAVLDSTLELPHIAASIGAVLHSDPMALPIAPLPCIRVPSIEPVNPITMPQALPILPLVPAPSGPALDPVPIVPSVDPVPLIPSIHEVVVHPAPIASPLVELPLVEITIAVELHAFPYDLLVASLSRFLHARLANEPLNGFRVGSRNPESLRALVPRVLEDQQGLVDQTLVLGREEQRHGDENQGQEQVLRSGCIFFSQIEQVEDEEQREEREDTERGHGEDRAGEPGRPGSRGRPRFPGLLHQLLFLRVFLVGGDTDLFGDRREAVNGRSDGRRRPEERGLCSRKLRLTFLAVHLVPVGTL